MTYKPRQWRVTVQFNREGYKPYLSKEAHLFHTFDDAFTYLSSLKPIEQNEERQLSKRVNMRNMDGSIEHSWSPYIWQTYEVWEWKLTLSAMILLVQKLQQLEKLVELYTNTTNEEAENG